MTLINDLINIVHTEQKYAALEVSNQCFCGQEFGSYGKVADSQCDQDCGGDSSMKCGGVWNAMILDTGLLGEWTGVGKDGYKERIGYVKYA